MASLRFTQPDGQSTEIPLKLGVNRVGRAEGNDILVPDDSVSSDHCELVADGGTVRVRDLGSTNGIAINGDLVREGLLRSGDLLRVGNLEFELVDQPASAPIPVPVTRMSPVPAHPHGAICRNHPGVAASWQCSKCGEQYCDACILDGRTLGVRGVKFCPACRSLANPLSASTPAAGGASRPASFAGEMLAAWKYPFRGDGPIIMIAGAVFLMIAGFVQHFVFLIGLFVFVLTTGYWMAYAEKVVSVSAQGEDDPPTWPDFSDFIEDILTPFFHALGLFALYLLPFFVAVFMLPEGEVGTYLIEGGLLLLGLFMMPMAWLAISTHNSMAGLSPHFVIPSILRIPGPYLAIFLELVFLVAVNIGLEIMLEQLTIPLLGPLISSFLSIYFLMVICRLLGVLYFLNRHRLAWF